RGSAASSGRSQRGPRCLRGGGTAPGDLVEGRRSSPRTAARRRASGSVAPRVRGAGTRARSRQRGRGSPRRGAGPAAWSGSSALGGTRSLELQRHRGGELLGEEVRAEQGPRRLGRELRSAEHRLGTWAGTLGHLVGGPGNVGDELRLVRREFRPGPWGR